MIEDDQAIRPRVEASGAGDNGSQAPVRSVARALELIEIVGDGPASGLTLAELARAVGVSKSAVLATLRTLASFGYVRAVGPGPHYKLGMNLVRLGDVAARRLMLTELCADLLRDLAEESGLTVRLAISDDGYPVFVDRVDGPGTIRFHTPLGGRELPHSTAAGKAILALLPPGRVDEIARETGLPVRTPKTIVCLDRLHEELAVVRELGYALDDEEDAEGVVCIGAAIPARSGVAAGALSMTSVKFDSDERLAGFAKLIMAYASRASELLIGKPYGDLRR